ncbi:MAG: hypothetical protein R3Y06_00020 [Faecalibacterium sp.]
MSDVIGDAICDGANDMLCGIARLRRAQQVQNGYFYYIPTGGAGVK